MLDRTNEAKASARDDIIALIIGIQNNLVDSDSPYYQGMSDVIKAIEERHGRMFSEYIN